MASSDYWDREAASFDEAADHGLGDPAVRDRWRRLLAAHLPGHGRALDVGCGTGSLSLLLAELGDDVTGIDASPRMIELAQQKASDAGQRIRFEVGDAADPQFGQGEFDVVLGRHILWALPDPRVALSRWAALLRPQGRFVLVEGFWHTGLGLHRTQVQAAMPAEMEIIAAEDIGADPAFWGRPVNDERYTVVAQRRG